MMMKRFLSGAGVFTTALAACTFGGGGSPSGAATLGGETGGTSDGADESLESTSLPADSTSGQTSTDSSGESSGGSSTGPGVDPTGGTTPDSTGSTAAGEVDSTSDDGGHQSSSSEGEPIGVCGDQKRDGDEDCDDGNEDETDGCLSTCVIPVSCQHILDELDEASDGAFRIAPDGTLIDAYCDMTLHGGGWTLVAKVNPANMDATAESEPVGWFDMVLEAGALDSPELVLNAPLQSHGASRFEPLLGFDSVARFEIIAQDDFEITPTTVEWYKRADLSFSQWFADDDTATEVCVDVDMMQSCSFGTIDASGTGACPMQGMSFEDYGYVANWWAHMRLENNGSTRRGVCSDTLDNQGNAWPDSYSTHWGNAMRIWLRE